MILLTCKTLRETRLRIKAVRDITLTLTLAMKIGLDSVKMHIATYLLKFTQLSISAILYKAPQHTLSDIIITDITCTLEALA